LNIASVNAKSLFLQRCHYARGHGCLCLKHITCIKVDSLT